ncbi:MAG: hypothetical protein K5696_08380 [Lachnospiraceae bacterium]|nr:hypothetical protein [Lachnospiraceae bacterium]
MNSQTAKTSEYTRTKGSSIRQTVICTAAMVICMLAVLLCGLSAAPQRNWQEFPRQEKQYEELTAAITSGQLSLLEEPAPFLAAMDNPYDPTARALASEEHGGSGLIDMAYYNGRYYVYFGVTPVLLLFLPVFLLTGRILQTWIAVILCAVLCVPVGFLFVRALCDRFFRDSVYSVRLLLSLFLPGVLGIPYLAAFCTTYSLPAVLGLLLLLTGFTLLLSAERPDGSMQQGKLACGSVCLALTIGCRPAFAAAYLLLFPLFGGAIRKGAFFRLRKDAVRNTAAVLLPAFVIGSGFLIYNALRFDNPFEFGFHYLFTTRDLLHGRHTPAQTLTGAHLLFLQMPILHRVFPFLETIEIPWQNENSLYVEPMFGGLLPLHPLIPAGLLLLPFLFIRRDRSGRVCRALALSSAALGVLLLFIDSSIAGISQRYESDFALFFYLPAAIGILTLCERPATSSPKDGQTTVSPSSDKRRQHALHFLIILLPILLFAEIFLSFSSILCDGRYLAMRDWNPAAYNRIAEFFH